MSLLKKLHWKVLVLLAVVAGAAGIAWFEVFKWMQGRRAAWP